MSKNLKDILAKLPTLSQDDLAVVVATATALGHRVYDRGKRPAKPGRPQAGKGSQVRPVDPKKKKGPAKPISPWANLSEYKEFREADFLLKKVMRERQKTLKELQAIEDPDEQLQDVLKNFLAKRDQFFRAKTHPKGEALEDDSKVQKAT